MSQQPQEATVGRHTPHVSSAGLYTFDKLDGIGSYHNWKFQMRMALIMEGLWSCIDGSETSSSMDQKALARICLAVKPNCIQYLRNATSAKQAWQKLQDVFEDKGLYRRVVLLRKLHRSDYHDYNSMGAYIEGIMTLVQQLADIGRVIDDKEVAEILLSGLPQDFDVLVSGLETANLSETLTSEAVRARLLQEEFRKSTNNGKSNDDVVLFTKRKPLKCHYCQKQGHIKSKCFKLKNDLKKQGSSDHNLAAGSADTLLVSVSLLSVYGSVDWIVDSGCTSHMCCDMDLFRDIDMNFKSKVTVANGEVLKCQGLGAVSLNLNNNSDLKILPKVMFVPKLTTNLISVSQLTKSGFSVVFKQDNCKIIDPQGQPFANATCFRGIYKLDCFSSLNCITECNVATTSANKQAQQSSLAATSSVPLEVWHKRLGHLSLHGMYGIRSLADDVVFEDDCHGKLKNCISCIKGKLTVKSFPKGQAKRAHDLLELIHSDVCGPMSINSWGGARYLVTFTDDFSRKSFGYLMCHKNEVMKCFIQFKNLVEKQVGKTIKRFRTDNGGEYCSKIFEKFLSSEGIIHETSIPYSPQQNGVSERLNRTLMEKARCMLSEACLDKRFWGEAIATAIYLKNRSPTAALSGGIPEQVWTGSKVTLSHLRVFGCKAFSLIPEHNRHKLDAKSKECIFVGYCEMSKGYRLVDPTEPKKIIKSRNVHFIELTDSNIKSNMINCDINCNKLDCDINTNNSKMINNNNFNMNDNVCVPMLNCNNNSSSELIPPSAISGGEMESESVGTEAPSINTSSNADGSALPSIFVDCDQVEENEQSWAEESDPMVESEGNSMLDTERRPSNNELPSQRPVRSTRGIPPKRYGDYEYDYSLHSHGQIAFDEPLSYEDAMASPFRVKWQAAMQAEYESLLHNGVWILVERPLDKNVVKCKWVYKIKQDTSGNFDKYKARLVARGFSQKPGIDFNETFSPVVRHSTMRILFNLANELEMDIEHIDVTTAFLHSELKEEIFMEQPMGYKNDSNKVCLLQKSIYGLKQASRVWNDSVNKLLFTNGYSQTKCEPCVYVKRNSSNLTILAIYVDDFFLFTNDSVEKKQLLSNLSNKFNIKNLGSIKNCLGINIVRNREKGTILLSQKDYIKRLLCRFGMSDCKGISTPMQLNEKFNKCDNNVSDNNYNFRELIGSLMYLSVCTRPDITYACNILSQFNNCYERAHWLAGKRILRYLAKTIDYGLVFIKCNNLDLIAYADADWANDPIDRKSYTGFVIKLGSNTVNWESRKQRCVAMSSTEAEYLAISDACKDILFIKQFWFEIMNRNIVCKLFNDNQSAQKILKSIQCHKRTKHIDIRYHFVRDLISKNCISVSYMPTTKMIADILTKALSSCKHNEFRFHLNVRTP